MTVVESQAVTRKQQVNFRLTDEVRAVLADLAARRGASQAMIVEWALREYLERQGFPVPSAAPRHRGRPKRRTEDAEPVDSPDV